MGGMPAVDSDDGKAGCSESVGDERAGYPGTNNRDVATTVSRQWWRHISQPVPEQPERLR
jgi:hypothetical protein